MQLRPSSEPEVIEIFDDHSVVRIMSSIVTIEDWLLTLVWFMFC